MGFHTNYYLTILALIRLKDELHRVKIPRLQPLIELLKTKEIILSEEEEEEVPSNKEIADELGYKVQRCNSMLKRLLEKLYEDFESNPLELSSAVHHVIIMYDYDEYKKFENNPYGLDSRSMFVKLKLKETPRIGEEIEFEVVPTRYIQRGTVEKVKHIVSGKTQYIEIRCHPYRNKYEAWMKLKEEYDECQVWKAYMETKQKHK